MTCKANKSTEPTPSPSNILIVKLSAIGDVIHTLPALTALRRLYPNAHITWVIEEAAADIIQGHPDLNRVIVSRRKQWLTQLKTGKCLGATIHDIKDFLSTLRDRPYDLVIDFHGLFKSAVVVWLSRGRRKLGYDSLQELSGLFYSEKIPEDMTRHAVDRYLDFIRYLGSNFSQEPVFLIAIQPENVEKVRTLLHNNGVQERARFIAVSPTAFWDTKMWENEKFAALCDRLIRETGLPVILTGASNDRSVQAIRSLMKEKSIDLTGQTSLKDLAQLYRQAAVLLTTDSGPMHLAAAVNTPVVALFGPTSPERTGPYGLNHTVVRTGIDCSPCFKKRCESRSCMKDLPIETVFQAIRSRLPMKED